MRNQLRAKTSPLLQIRQSLRKKASRRRDLRASQHNSLFVCDISADVAHVLHGMLNKGTPAEDKQKALRWSNEIDSSMTEVCNQEQPSVVISTRYVD